MLLLNSATASEFGGETLQSAEDLLLNVRLLRLLPLQAALLLHEHLHCQAQAVHLGAQGLNLILQSPSSVLECLLGVWVPVTTSGTLASRGL